jgi:molybdopterin-containing oxidoreductase family membrane subunit
MFMLEKAAHGRRGYWAWIGILSLLVLAGFLAYLDQLNYGLGVTGMSRNVTWGLYIGQFTFLVGIAASAVMVVLPYYLHNHKEFVRMTILGEFLAISAVTMCGLFIFVDMGQPMRVLNVIRYPHPGSIMFWDMISLSGYWVLNVVITLVTMHSDQTGTAPPSWIKLVIVLSIPWAISIHTVTAFLYSGLPGRSFWLTALLAPRFLASAFASGPAFLILLCLLIRRLTGYDVGTEAVRGLAMIVTYAMLINVFFVLMEFFTAFYSQIPALTEHFENMYLGMPGEALPLLVWGRVSLLLMAGAVLMLLFPRTRTSERVLTVACGLTFLSLWIDKGLCLVVCGFVPSPLGTITRYVPTLPEMTITLGVWAAGALMITVFYNIALSVAATKELVPAAHYESTQEAVAR